MEKKLLTFEEFTKSNERTPENVKAYILYLKENTKGQWVYTPKPK